MRLRPDDRRWLEFIARHPSATIFHHPAWIGVLAECYGFHGEIVATESRDGGLAAGIPVMEMTGLARGRRLAALPFSDHCAPLAADDAACADLLDLLDLYRKERRVRHLEIRWPLAVGRGYRGEEFHLHRTDLAGSEDEIFLRFHRTRVQQSIRAAERAGVAVRCGETDADLRTFYRMHLMTRVRLGTPVQPFRFFQLLHERLLRRGLGFILFAERAGHPLATGLFLHWNGVLTYKFGASDPTAWDYSPNHALLWEAMRWGARHGCVTFDWGRTDSGHAGLREFKRAWGTSEEPAASTILADAPPGAAGPPALRNLVAQLIRRSPPWVCRMIGELFYGQFG